MQFMILHVVHSLENVESLSASIPTNLRLITDLPAAVNVVLELLDLSENPDKEPMTEDGKHLQ